MTRHQKSWLLFLSFLTVGAILILASGLPNLDMDQEGGPFPRMPGAEETDVPSSIPSSHVLDTLLRVLFTVAGALLPFAIIYYLVVPDARRRLLRDLIALLIVLVPLYLLWRARPEALDTLEGAQMPQAAPHSLPAAPEVAFSAEPEQWLVMGVSILTALLLAGLLVGVGWTVWRRTQRPARPLDRLGQQAQEAIDAIETGADLRDTIMRCYFQMMQVLSEERGIRRQRAMTPREFAAGLERVGMPLTQVHRLTQLFEEVRYGDKVLGTGEERQAVVALTTIVRLCRGDL